MTVQVPKNREELLEMEKEAGVSFPYSDDTSVFAEPLTVGGRVIPNRVCYQAMEGCDSTPEGVPDELTRRRYQRFAKGGAGLVWYEATAVLPEGRANPRQSYIHEGNLDAFRREVEEIKKTCLKENGYEPVVICQLTHSGRYSKPEGVPAPLIAYNNPIFEKDNPISRDRIVSDEYLDRVKEALVQGASLAERAGFDGADIKCCHRYLLSELLSADEREGRYGGSFENRTRLFREAVEGALQGAGRDFIITTRMNAYDGFPHPYGFGVNPGEGITPDFSEAIRLVKTLWEKGVRLVDITMGNPYFNPHVNRPFAKGGYDHPEHPLYGVYRMLEGIGQIKRAVPEMAVISSGISFLGGGAPGVLAGAIREGWFDMAGFGRQTLAYPDVARDLVTKGEMDQGRLCLACGKCTEIMRQKGGTPGCVVRDAAVYAPLYRELVLKK